jgi:hypothetical protein
MSGPAKIVLKQNLSQETLGALKTYMGQFFNERHVIEEIEGRVEIHLHDSDDLRMLRRHFPSLITGVDSCR